MFDVMNEALPFQSSCFKSFSILGISMVNLLIRLKACRGLPTSLSIYSVSDSVSLFSSRVPSKSRMYLKSTFLMNNNINNIIRDILMIYGWWSESNELDATQ